MIDPSAQLRRLVDDTVASVTSADGRLFKAEATEALAEAIRTSDNPLLRNLFDHKAAQQLLRECGERFSPRRLRRKAGSLYHPRWLIKLGRGEWVRMAFATETDMNAWSTYSQRNTDKAIASNADVQRFYAARRPGYRKHGVRILHEVEQLEFGYQGSIDDIFPELT